MLFAAYADCHMFEKAVPIENKMTWGCAILDTATAFKHKKESQNKGAFLGGHLNQDFKKTAKHLEKQHHTSVSKTITFSALKK